MRYLLLAVMYAAVLAITVAPVHSATPDRMAPLGFYVGTWSCVDGPIGRGTHKGTWTFEMRSGVMFESIIIPKQRDVPYPSVTNATFAFDQKNNRYVETEMDNTAAWYVSVAKPDWKNVISWKDIASWTQLSHWDMARLDLNHFMVVAYPTATAIRPNYKGVCKRVAGSSGPVSKR